MLAIRYVELTGLEKDNRSLQEFINERQTIATNMMKVKLKCACMAFLSH